MNCKSFLSSCHARPYTLCNGLTPPCNFDLETFKEESTLYKILPHNSTITFGYTSSVVRKIEYTQAYFQRLKPSLWPWSSKKSAHSLNVICNLKPANQPWLHNDEQFRICRAINLLTTFNPAVTLTLNIEGHFQFMVMYHHTKFGCNRLNR